MSFPETGCRYLSPADMRRVAGYRFAPRAPVEGFFSGHHRSRERGQSTEFRDYRPYAAGDDTAKIDWRVFARSDRLYLRNFHQETSVNCYVFLDSSTSMGFGAEQSKLDFASRFAAALSYLVVAGGDLSALYLFDSGIRFSAPPGSTRLHLHRVLGALDGNRPGGETSVAKALREAEPHLSKRGSLIVLSDFFEEPAPVFDALNRYLHRGFRIYLYQILAPEEIALPDTGLSSFRDSETGARITAHSRDIARAYAEEVESHTRNLRASARRRQIFFERARTGLPWFPLLDPLVVRPR